ncbi:hypothetical protein PDR5_46470 [Pseudomonas sp. DR 5-09]|nr:hypothetical protein PDR5_46470 [Pseudomonas sp. DR 5-09]
MVFFRGSDPVNRIDRQVAFGKPNVLSASFLSLNAKSP